MPTTGKAIPHDSAVGHVTGQAWYIDDIPSREDELIVGFLGSPTAKGKLKSIDLANALKDPDVVAIYTADDIPGHNIFGAIVADEPFLVEEDLEYKGQPVAVIAAKSEEAIERAKAAIVLDCEEQEPVFTITQARELKSWLGPHRVIARGDFESAYAKAPNKLERRFENGGQDHFYLENQACIAIPAEEDQVKVISSTQNPTETQNVIAEVLGLGMHQVVCECKRMGGGFGGKETQSSIPAIAAAMVSIFTGHAARFMFTKDDDMMLTGKRHPYQCDYKVGFDDAGNILALRYEFFSNGGAYSDLSGGILERTQLHAENSYYIPDIEINAQICKTNLPPNTAFRGFGGPQGMAAMENIIEEIAQHLKKDALEIRRANCYGKTERNVTPYGQLIEENMLPELFDETITTSDYEERRKEIEAFNRTSKTHLRGLSLTPIKFGISFTASFLNQGNALVNVYMDGTVQVSTGGTEMGQGLNVKIRQLVADVFGLPIERVVLMTTSTEKNNNTSPTAASAGTDLNGSAAMIASEKIRARMAEFAAHHFADDEHGIHPDSESIRFEDGIVFDKRWPERLRIPFGEFCNLARMNRVNMGERAFYRTPGVGFNRDTGKGNPFFYYTCGTAAAEVLIDRFTGELKVERVDMLMDIGKSLNPGVDRGQVIGGFIQGMGWVTAEKLTWNDKGDLLSHSPTTYKIPGSDDVPHTFNVNFLDNPNHKKNVGHSKAVGEPPLMLSICVWAAVKNALSYLGDGIATNDLTLPATGEEILRVMTLIRNSQREVSAPTS